MDVMITREKPSFAAWYTVGMLAFVGCLNYLDRTMITTMRESIVGTIPMSDAQFGLLTSAFLWTYGVISPFAGYVADRYNRSRVIIVSLFLWSSVTWLTAFATSFEGLLATRILMGVSEACYIPAALALIMDYHRTDTRSLATGIHMVGIMIGSALGFVGGWFAETHKWNHAFLITGILGTIYSVFLVFSLHDIPNSVDERHNGAAAEEKVNFLAGVRGLFKVRSFNWVVIAWGVAGIVTWMVVGWLPTYFQEHFNLSQGMAGFYATGLFYPAAMVGLLLGGYSADRWSRVNERSRLWVPAIGFCIGAPCVFFGSMTAILPLAVACFMIYALTKAFLDTNMMPILCMMSDDRYRATGYGILNLVSCIIGGMGLYLGGALRDAHIMLDKSFKIAALLMLISSLILWLVKKPSAMSGPSETK